MDLECFFDSFHFGRVCGYFEKNKDVILAQEVTICPSEEVVYKMNLLYLDVCNKLIAEKCK